MSRSYGDFEGFERPEEPLFDGIKQNFWISLANFRKRCGPLTRLLDFAMGIDTDQLTFSSSVEPAPATSSPAVPRHEKVSLDRQKAENSIETFFEADLDIAIHPEKDPWIRLVVYGLMALQIWKLSAVTGAPFVRVIGFLYAFSWLTVELLSILSTAPSSPSEYEKAEAKGLWRRCVVTHASIWVSEASYWRASGIAMDMSLSLFWLTMCSTLFVHACLVFFLLICVSDRLPDALQWKRLGVSKGNGGISYGDFPSLLALFGVLVLGSLSWHVLVVPIWLSWVQKQILSLWNRLLPEEFQFAPSWERQGKSVFTAFLLSTPNWLALSHYLLIVFALLGFDYWILWDVRYHCWGTTKPSFYEWLG